MSLMGHPALQLLAGLLGQRESASNDSPIGSSIFAGFTSKQWAVGHEMLPKAALLRGSEPSPNIWYFWPIRYDTIRDAILTCARKPTWVSLIYRTETTTKNCKTEKQKSKNRYARSNSKSLGNHVVRSEKKKKGCCGKDLQKRKVLSLEWKRE